MIRVSERQSQQARRVRPWHPRALICLAALDALAMGASGCANNAGDAEAAVPREVASTAATEAAEPSESAIVQDEELCSDATELTIKGLQKAWTRVASVSPEDRIAPPLLALTWALKYEEAMSAMERAGCPTPPTELSALDQTIPPLQAAADEGGFYMRGAVMSVSTELAAAAETAGIEPPRPDIVPRAAPRHRRDCRPSGRGLGGRTEAVSAGDRQQQERRSGRGRPGRRGGGHLGVRPPRCT